MPELISYYSCIVQKAFVSLRLPEAKLNLKEIHMLQHKVRVTARGCFHCKLCM